MNSKVFENPKPIIGVLQLFPLPGSAEWKGRIDHVIARAEQEATALATGGVDGILVENTFDAPYAKGRMDTAGAIAMGLIIKRIMHFTHLPIGVSVLQNDPETALAIAMNVGAKFIRVGLLTGAAISSNGILEGKHRDLLAYKQRLQVEGISVFADISLEKTIPLAGDGTKTGMNLSYLAKQAVSAGGADGIILTDTTITPKDINEIKQFVDVPVLYDFGNPLSFIGDYLPEADGLILSSALKKTSLLSQEDRPKIDLAKVEEAVAMAEVVRAEDTETSLA